MAVSARRPRRKRVGHYHHGDLQRALLSEAVRTIAVGGVETLTLRQVGARLGVSRTALYRHFSDKSTLLAAVAREGFERFTDDLRQAWAQAEGTRRGFELMGTAYVQFAVTHPAHYRVMFGDYRRLCGKDPALQTAAAASYDVLAEALRTLQAAGLIVEDDLHLLAQYIWAIVHGLAMLAVDGQLGPACADPASLHRLVGYALRRLGSGIDRAGAGTAA